MIAPPGGLWVWLACGVTDMRKGMVGLAMMVQQGLLCMAVTKQATGSSALC